MLTHSTSKAERTSFDVLWWQWTLVALIVLCLVFGGPYGAILRAAPGRGPELTLTPGRAVAYWLAWLPAVPLLGLAYRFRFRSRFTVRRLVIHVALAWASSGLHALAFVIWGRSGFFTAPMTINGTIVWFEATRGLWDYTLFLALIHLVVSVQTVRERDREAARQELVRARLEAEVARSEIAALQSQLHPHFLFNTLNSIAVLTTQDPHAAQTMVVQLGALLRAVIQTSQDHLIPVRRELDFVDRYLAIQRVRFRDRLRVQMRVDEEALDVVIPSMLIQSLIENAIRHAIEATGEGTIVLAVERVGDRVRVSVEDDGVPDGMTPSAGTGIGLKNVERRMALLFGDRHHVDVRRRGDHGTIASVEMPLVPAS